MRPAASLLVAALALSQGAAPVRAQPAQAPEAAAAPAARHPRGHLWWNDEELVAKLALGAEQRKRMDAAYEKFQGERANPAQAREAFHAALRQGKLDEARRELSAWASADSAQVSAAGNLKLEVLSLLDAEQRKQLQTANPNLLNAMWVPRVSWAAAGKRQRPPAPR